MMEEITFKLEDPGSSEDAGEMMSTYTIKQEPEETPAGWDTEPDTRIEPGGERDADSPNQAKRVTVGRLAEGDDDEATFQRYTLIMDCPELPEVKIEVLPEHCGESHPPTASHSQGVKVEGGWIEAGSCSEELIGGQTERQDATGITSDVTAQSGTSQKDSVETEYKEEVRDLPLDNAQKTGGYTGSPEALPSTSCGEERRETDSCHQNRGSGKTRRQRGSEVAHISLQEGDFPHECSICNEIFTHKRQLTKHLKIHSRAKPCKCWICNKSFKSRLAVSEHMRIHTGKCSYHCSHCGKMYSSKDSLAQHVRIHTGMRRFQCSHCGKTFSSKVTLVKHEITHTEKGPDQCFGENRREADSSSEELVGDQTESQSATGIASDVTAQSGTSQKDSVETEYKEEVPDLPLENPEETDGYSCSPGALSSTSCGDERRETDSCHQDRGSGKTRRQRGSEVTHISLQGGDFPHECSICDDTFMYKHQLTEHMKIHRGRQLYQCSLCNKSFKSKSSLAGHEKIHTGERSYQCSYCGKTFPRNHTLVKHMRIHTGERPYQCSFCSKTFKCTSNLAVHVRTHSGERPHHCSVCNKTFVEKANLARHMLVHTEGPRIECNFCNKTFKRKSNLLQHTQTHSTDR